MLLKQKNISKKLYRHSIQNRFVKIRKSYLLAISKSALWFSKYFTIPRCPSKQAARKGVEFVLVVQLGLALWLIRAFTMLKCPAAAAHHNGGASVCKRNNNLTSVLFYSCSKTKHQWLLFCTICIYLNLRTAQAKYDVTSKNEADKFNQNTFNLQHKFWLLHFFLNRHKFKQLILKYVSSEFSMMSNHTAQVYNSSWMQYSIL